MVAGKQSPIFSLILLVLTLPVVFVSGQDRGKAYLVPQTVYVGDRATLVVPLPQGMAGTGGDAQLGPELQELSSPDIELRRVALERRPAGSRLLVEFSAFRPGPLELPPLEIGGGRFAGLVVEIASIIDSGDKDSVLSPPATPLAIPGTGFLMYGTLAALALFILLGLWIMLWGRKHLGGWILKWKRGRLIAAMRGIERRLRKMALKERQYRETLNLLSAEFRAFLSFFTGQNCRAMTAAEFGCLAREPLFAALAEFDVNIADVHVVGANTGGGFLGAFFSRCDAVRFSGEAIRAPDVFSLLDALRRFLAALEKAEKKAAPEKPPLEAAA
jgi:hypothetical protein